MFSTIDDSIDFSSLHFTYLNPEDRHSTAYIPPRSQDIIALLPPIEYGESPFRFDAKKHQDYLNRVYSLIDLCTQWASKTATLYLHGLPHWLPYFGVYLQKKGWHFKYWIALETYHPMTHVNPMVQTHQGILLYVKDKNRFNLRKVRSAHQRCDVCGDYTADWGGKKHLRNPNGYAISDVWDDLPHIKDTRYVLSAEVWERLVLMSANDNSRILCIYNGDHNLANVIFE